jgi:hypothetical protein
MRRPRPRGAMGVKPPHIFIMSGTADVEIDEDVQSARVSALM